MRFEEIRRKHVNNGEVDEALPAIGAAAARGGATLAKGIGKAVGTVGKALGGAVKKVGAKAVQGATGTGKSTARDVAQKAQAMVSQELLKKGSKLPMPTQNGQEKEFEIDDVQGDEVTLINPDANTKPEEPEKVTYKKKDLDTIIKNLAAGQQQQ